MVVGGSRMMTDAEGVAKMPTHGYKNVLVISWTWDLENEKKKKCSHGEWLWIFCDDRWGKGADGMWKGS